jgi:hypothetical protein
MPTERDVRVCTALTAWRAMTIEQVAGVTGFRSSETCRLRLSELEQKGLLRVLKVAPQYPGVVVVTQKGAGIASTGLRAARRPGAKDLPHTLAVVDLARFLLDRNPGSCWQTERELRYALLSVQEGRRNRSGLLVGQVPHLPDGVLRTADGARIAIELELSTKVVFQYRRIMRFYATPGSVGAAQYDACVWFSDREAVRRRIQGIVNETKTEDVVSVVSLPESVIVRRWT